MQETASILNAQIQFLDVQLTLIHIPIELYSQFVHQILQIILPESGDVSENPFVNITVNPVEASIVLPRQLANKLFKPLAGAIYKKGDQELTITIAPDDYILMFVSGSDSSPSQRVIDLTTPLALAGISIFFITTYFSDYIICPRRAQDTVIAALKSQGFELNEHNWGQINQHSSQAYSHRPTTASSDSSGSFLAPGTPPPITLSDMQIKTFNTLKKRNIVPSVDKETRLVQCAGKDDAKQEHMLLLSIVKLLLATPKFFSLTLAEGEAPSILLETRFLPLFKMPTTTWNGHSLPHASSYDQSLLLGTQSDVLIPIILDLRTLPLESTGIVCGIAGRLVDATKQELPGPVELGYLSTTKAGAVMMMECDLDRAVSILEMGSRVES